MCNEIRSLRRQIHNLNIINERHRDREKRADALIKSLRTLLGKTLTKLKEETVND